MDLAEVVRTRLKTLGMSRALLVERLSGRVSRNAIYSFLAGGSRGMGSKSLGLLLDELDLRVTAKDNVETERVKADAVLDAANRIYLAVAERLDHLGTTPTINAADGKYMRWGAAEMELVRIVGEVGKMIVRSAEVQITNSLRRR